MKVKILWAEYDLEYRPRLIDQSDGSVDFGQEDFWNRKLLIEDFLSDDHKRITVAHELLHAISYLSGLDLTESQVRGLSHLLYTVMQENPKLVQHMIPGGKR